MDSASAVMATEVGLCSSCASRRQMKFLGEICLHFSGGLESLNKPLVWVFPQLVVCLDCGSAQFTVPDAELRQLKDGTAAA